MSFDAKTEKNVQALCKKIAILEQKKVSETAQLKEKLLKHQAAIMKLQEEISEIEKPLQEKSEAAQNELKKICEETKVKKYENTFIKLSGRETSYVDCENADKAITSLLRDLPEAVRVKNELNKTTISDIIASSDGEKKRILEAAGVKLSTRYSATISIL